MRFIALITLIASLSFVSSAQANTLTSVANGAGPQGEILSGHFTTPHVGDRYFGSSDTATFFFKKGISKLEQGNLEKSAAAFRASLRAQGTDRLNKFTLHYLAYINQQLGNTEQAESYAQSYLAIDKKIKSNLN